MRLKGETNVFSLENPTSFIGNCFPFLSLELFRFGEGRNRVCSSSIPSEAYDIIDLRATARTVGEAALKSESITAFVVCNLGAAELFRCDLGRNRVCSISTPSESYDIIDLRATARTVGFLRFGD